MTEMIKYGRTYHLPFSPGLKNDDRRLEDEYCFDGKRVVVTCKLDGENTSCYREGIHARSLYAMSHPSQHYMKAYWASIKHNIPEGWRICGESMYARHSIAYNDLESFFYIFNIWNEKNIAIPWSKLYAFCKENALHHVPVLGFVNIKGNDFSEVEKLFNLAVENGEEGIVIHNVEGYKYEDFQSNVAKAVRKNHVQTDDKHWTKNWVPNKLKEK